MKKKIHIDFAKFWNGFDKQDNFFTRILAESYDVVVGPGANFVFFSVFPGDLPAGKYCKIFYTGENCRPDMTACDWAFSFDYLEHPKHYRLPNYVLHGAGTDLVKTPHFADIAVEKTKFCNFIQSNNVRFRNLFFDLLSCYKRIDAPGKCRNNISGIEPRYGNWEAGRVAFGKPYKFSIAFENASYPGYTTEKIYLAMLSGSLPIYWGDPLVGRDFNSKSFVNYHEYEARCFAAIPKILLAIPLLGTILRRLYLPLRTLASVIGAVVRIDKNEALYRTYLEQPWCHGNLPPKAADRELLKQRFHEIFQ